MSKQQVLASVLSNTRLQSDYFRMDLHLPGIAEDAQPGQFVHVQIPDLEHRILRRPFSIFDTDPATQRLSLIYKVVGTGTEQLSRVQTGATLDVCGPLGTPFSPLPPNAILVAGGYGCAATHLLAKRAAVKPVVLIGARSSDDILLVREYQSLGCRVELATNDGSLGFKGYVTQLLEQVLAPGETTWIASCGPIPMLKALAGFMANRALDGELSMDKAMCCGVGACFACVTKVKADTPDGWRYARVCAEGPVFKASNLIFD